MTTTYLRAFTADELNALRGYLIVLPLLADAAEHPYIKAVEKAVNTPVHGESIAMHIVCAGWNQRAAVLGLPKRGAKRDADREAYMQGALATMLALGVMPVDRANMIGFLTACGRLGEYVDGQAARADTP